MKIYSIIIMSLTVVLFYSLAVQQQNNRKETKSYNKNVYVQHYDDVSEHPSDNMIEEEFSFQVTGKEHRYLNTGISLLEDHHMIQNDQCIADNSRELEPQVSGS